MTEARLIARNYLRSIGTTAPLRSQSTARVGAAELINDKYHVSVKLGLGSPIPTQKATILVDAETGSEWDFSGTAIAGPLVGQVLKRWPVYSDYWFDWKRFHPDSPVYTAGEF